MHGSLHYTFFFRNPPPSHIKKPMFLEGKLYRAFSSDSHSEFLLAVISGIGHGYFGDTGSSFHGIDSLKGSRIQWGYLIQRFGIIEVKFRQPEHDPVKLATAPTSSSQKFLHIAHPIHRGTV